MMRQVDAGDRAQIEARRIEQREERALGRAVEALHDQPALVVAAARPGGEHRLAGGDIGTEVEGLRRARAVVDALDAAVDREAAAEGQVTDGVLLQRGARRNALVRGENANTKELRDKFLALEKKWLRMAQRHQTSRDLKK